MKKGAVLAFVVLFAACLFHFYYAEDHCPVHCPTRGGQVGHVHPHHAGASICLCFLAALASPEADDLPAAVDLTDIVAQSAEGRPLGRTVKDLTPPPRPSFA